MGVMVHSAQVIRSVVTFTWFEALVPASVGKPKTTLRVSLSTEPRSQ